MRGQDYDRMITSCHPRREIDSRTAVRTRLKRPGADGCSAVRHGRQRRSRCSSDRASASCSATGCRSARATSSPTGSDSSSLLVAALSAFAVTAPDLSDAVGDSAPVLIVLGPCSSAASSGRCSGSSTGSSRSGAGCSAVRPRGRLRRAPPVHRGVRRPPRCSSASGRSRCSGRSSDGLGDGADQLILKSTLDGFAAIAFAATFGWGVAASAVVVGVVQGTLTLLGRWPVTCSPKPSSWRITATGGLLLAGVGLRLLQLKAVPVGDLLPALLVAPVLTATVIAIR